MPVKENIKAQRHWPLCREFTGTGEFLAQRASDAKTNWWRHHESRNSYNFRIRPIKWNWYNIFNTTSMEKEKTMRFDDDMKNTISNVDIRQIKIRWWYNSFKIFCLSHMCGVLTSGNIIQIYVYVSSYNWARESMCWYRVSKKSMEHLWLHWAFIQCVFVLCLLPLLNAIFRAPYYSDEQCTLIMLFIFFLA